MEEKVTVHDVMEIEAIDFKIENHNKFGLPEYKTLGSSGIMDLRANFEESVVL